MAKLQPQKFRMIYSMIEVDDGLNTHCVIRKINGFILFAANWRFLKILEDLKKPCLVYNNGFEFFMQNSNLIFKSKLLTKFV